MSDKQVMGDQPLDLWLTVVITCCSGGGGGNMYGMDTQGFLNVILLQLIATWFYHCVLPSDMYA